MPGETRRGRRAKTRFMKCSEGRNYWMLNIGYQKKDAEDEAARKGGRARRPKRRFMDIVKADMNGC